LFYAPRRRKQLRDWAFPHNNNHGKLPHKIDGSDDDDRDDDDDRETAEIKGRQNGFAEEFDQINACIAEVMTVLDTADITGLLSTDDNGGEIAEVKRGQDSLTEEGLSLRNEITSTTPPCRRITRSMTMARQKEISLCSDNASNDEVQQDHLEEKENDEMVHNNETNKEQQECPAEEITDQTDNTDNGVCHGTIPKEEITKMKIYHGTILRKGMITKMTMARTTTIG